MSEFPPRLNLIQRAMKQAQASNPARTEPTLGAPPSSLKADIDGLATPDKRPDYVAAKEPAAAPGAHKFAGDITLNYARLRESRIALPGDRNSLTFNEFRSVKRKLLPLTTRSGADRRAQNIVMVTSALPAEGKTFTSINLAITLATEKNLDVILVDGDVIRGSLGKYFSGQNSRGLIDLFSNTPGSIDDVLHRCRDLPNLHVIFSGTQNDTAPELFASARMAEICDGLSRRFPQSIIIIDSPPVLATSEPAALVTHIDHLIMVVAAGRSNRHQVETAVSALSSCRSMFLLLNKAPKWQRPSQGSYYYSGSPAP